MLKKIYRLSTPRLEDYKEFKSRYVKFKYSNNDLNHPRFAFVISKKIDQRAVARNSLKRKLSVSIEEIFDKIGAGVDIVLIPSKKSADVSQQELNKDILDAFSKERLIND